MTDFGNTHQQRILLAIGIGDTKVTNEDKPLSVFYYDAIKSRQPRVAMLALSGIHKDWSDLEILSVVTSDILEGIPRGLGMKKGQIRECP